MIHSWVIFKVTFSSGSACSNCADLIKNGPHRFIYLSAWLPDKWSECLGRIRMYSIGGGVISAGLGVAKTHVISN